MRDDIQSILGATIDSSIVSELLDSYEDLLADNRAGDFHGALVHAGRLVEHTLRAIEFLRTGTMPTSIKSVAATVKIIEADTSIDDSLRLLIPRVAYGLIYNLRSKRNAVHVNEIDPSSIDAAMAVSASGWIISELLRLYHVGSVEGVKLLMASLVRTKLPIVEVISGDVVVSAKVPTNVELLLLLSHAAPRGMTRSQLGRMAKCSPSSVTRGLQALDAERLIHKAGDDAFYLTGPGEQFLSDWLDRKWGWKREVGDDQA